MATGTNAIATEKEAHDKVHKTTGYTYTENKACTKK